MKYLLIAVVFITSLPTDSFEECRDRCAENMKRCITERCENIPTDEERSKCWMNCAASPEVHGCYEKCEADRPPL